MYRFALVVLVMVVACSDPTDHPYAEIDGKSINGIGLFKSVLESSGYDVKHASILRSDEDANLIFCFDKYGQGLSESVFDEFMTYVDESTKPTAVFYICPTYLNNAEFWQRQFELFSDRNMDPDQQKAFLARQFSRTNQNIEVYPFEREPITERRFEILNVAYGDYSLAAVPIDAFWRTEADFESVLYTDSSDYALVQYSSKETDQPEGVVLVANPYLFMNYALVREDGRDSLNELLSSFPFGDEATIIDFPFTHGSQSADDLGISHFLAVFPISVIALQGLILLALFFWRMSPVIGYGKRERVQESISFRRHVDAFARLLKDTGRADVAFAVISRFLWRENPSHPHGLNEALNEIRKREDHT